MASQSLESVPPVDTPPVPPPVVPETTERPESVPMNTHQEGILQKKVKHAGCQDYESFVCRTVFGQDAHIIWFFGWFAYLMCEDMTLPELRTEWEQLNRLREEFQDAANAFEKILDGGFNRCLFTEVSFRGNKI